MQNKTTHYQIILDSSGSMSDCRHATINTFNEHLQSIKAIQREFPDQNIRISLTNFSHEVKEVFVDRVTSEVNMLNDENYKTDGSTKLLDAIGKCIQRMEFVHGQDIAQDKASVVFLILTDGEENASTIFNYHQVAGMIERLQATGKWAFTFLGA
ncbi:MAG: VWA domain-containing protein, partial [Flavobacteriales bacterium]